MIDRFSLLAPKVNKAIDFNSWRIDIDLLPL